MARYRGAMQKAKYRAKRSSRWATFLAEIHDCYYCGIVVDSSGSGAQLDDGVTLDHIRPHCEGGAYSVDNFVSACQMCNNIRGTQDFVSFVAFAQEHIVPYRNDLAALQEHFLSLDMPESAKIIASFITRRAQLQAAPDLTEQELA